MKRSAQAIRAGVLWRDVEVIRVAGRHNPFHGGASRRFAASGAGRRC